MRGTEPPNFYHRWCIIASLGAYLERQFYFHHGHMRVNTNMYVLLLGKSGTKKSTAIKLAKKTLIKTGFKFIAADKTSKEKFLIDLDGKHEELNGHDVLDSPVWGESDENAATPCFIMADEFNSFFGNDILSFVSDLGVLFDYEGMYRNRLKNSRSVEIPNPTISILGGNTPTTFAETFPPNLLGQGFFSRLLLIHAEPVPDKKRTFQEDENEEETNSIVNQFQQIKATCIGRAGFSDSAKSLVNKIYHSFTGIGDVRFEAYSNRRFEQLIKLCLLHAAAQGNGYVDELSVVRANTILCFTERLMPRALGEFGRSRNADVSHKIIEYMESRFPAVVTIQEIWKQVHNDLEKLPDLQQLLQGLRAAEKIQITAGNTAGFLLMRRVAIEQPEDTIDWSYLTDEERRIKI